MQEDLVFVAAGNITSNAGLSIQAGDATKGYNITFISGASFTATGGADSPAVGPVSGAPPYPGSGSVTITGKGSKSGGSVILGANNLVSSRSTETAAGNLNAGNVNFIAFGKKTGGTVDISGARVVTGGTNNGSNGNVNIIAAASGVAQAVRVGEIVTTNQTAAPEGVGGDVIISNTVPTIVGADTVTYDAAGKLVGPGSFAPGVKLVKNSGVFFANNKTLPGGGASDIAGNLNVDAGSVVEFESVVTAKTASIYGDLAVLTSVVESPPGTFTPGDGKLIADEVLLETGKGGFIGFGPGPSNGSEYKCFGYQFTRWFCIRRNRGHRCAEC